MLPVSSEGSPEDSVESGTLPDEVGCCSQY